MSTIDESLERWCKAAEINFETPAAEKAYKKRTKRIADVIRLKVPDRVPVTPCFGFFPALDNGYSCQDVMDDCGKAHEAWMKTLLDFEPDYFLGSGYAMPAKMFEILGCTQIRLPGRDVASNLSFQTVEAEYLKAEEFYDAFLEDPEGFLYQTYLSRLCANLKGFETFPSSGKLLNGLYGLPGWACHFGLPEMKEVFDTLSRAGDEALLWLNQVISESNEIKTRGYPTAEAGWGMVPFDMIGNFFRGTRGIMLDMYRCPDKLLKAIEALVPIVVKRAVEDFRRGDEPIVSYMLHKGSHNFMSLDQFKTFYWPSLREIMVQLIGEGIVPLPLFEGDYTSRLEVIRDIPEKSAIYWFETMDMVKAKEVLGDTVCIRGNVPISMLSTGTPDEVEGYVKHLIDTVGKDGGLIVDCGAWFDEAPHENVMSMVQTTKQYGVYT